MPQALKSSQGCPFLYTMIESLIMNFIDTIFNHMAGSDSGKCYYPFRKGSYSRFYVLGMGVAGSCKLSITILQIISWYIYQLVSTLSLHALQLSRDISRPGQYRRSNMLLQTF